jgi:hypothetical protein
MEMPKLAHHPADFGVFGKLHMPILVTVLAGILNLIWICCGDGEILYVVLEKVAKLMFIQNSNTLITLTYTHIHSHTLTYSQIHSNTLKYNVIHTHTIMTITKIPYTHINSRHSHKLMCTEYIYVHSCTFPYTPIP